MPKLWNETIEAHRRDVGDAILETTRALVAREGLRGVTMSRIAEETGIGRATLYKYFPDVESILVAWHERHVTSHLAAITQIRERTGDPLEKLRQVFETYALVRQEHHDADLIAVLERGGHVERSHRHLAHLIRDLIAEAAKSRQVRKDVPSDELASFCIHALGAAAKLSSKTAVRRLVDVTLAALRP